MNRLRRAMEEGRTGLNFVGAPSALFARLIEAQGCDGVYLSGAVLSQCVHGIADDGTVTLAQLADFAGTLCRATRLPVIADADTGFGGLRDDGAGGYAEGGDETDVALCVRTLEAAGVAGIQIEDQVPAKKCGHLDGKQLEPVEVMEAKLRSAAAARQDPALVLIARTDARGVTGYDDALERARRYRAAGADMIFIEALPDAAEFARFAADCPGPLLANMTEFGKSPLLPRADLAAMGYTVVIYPATLMRLMLTVAEQALHTMAADGHQKGLLDGMWSRARLYDLIGYDHAVPDSPDTRAPDTLPPTPGARPRE